eukprot:g2329.t1
MRPPKFSIIIRVGAFLATVAYIATATSNDNDIEEVYLQPLLKYWNGTQVRSPEDWFDYRRPQVSEALQDVILGHLPDTTPIFLRAETLNRTKTSSATLVFYRLFFRTSPKNDVSFDVEVMIPQGRSPSNEGFPIFLTQWNHRGWAEIGLSRGYVSVLYPGGDTRDAAPIFQQAYANATFMLILARAFVASRTIDFLSNETATSAAGLPSLRVDQICISGHSRNGKQSLIAAAFDSRIGAVVGSSPGAPIASPYFFSSHNFYGEGPDAGQAGHWWLQSVAQFAAHPEAMKMDGHGVLAMIAPRHAMISNGFTDHEGEISFADELNVRAATRVFALLGRNASTTNAIRLVHRPGDHHGFLDVDTYFDFFDSAFRRGCAGGESCPFGPLPWLADFAASSSSSSFDGVQTFLTAAGFDWQKWNRAFGDRVPPAPATTASLKDRVRWLTQYDDVARVRSVGSSYSEDGENGNRFSYRSVMMGTNYDETNPQAIKRLPVSFGRYVTANVYFNPKLAAVEGYSAPAVVWLHPYSYATGFATTYGSASVVEDLVAKANVTVLAFDQIGFGSRVREGGNAFYNRYADGSSLLGHMISDVLATYPFKLDEIPVVSEIILAGYSLGGSVALHAAALDNRVDRVAAFAAFTPMRTDTNDRPTLGIKRLYDLHALIPRLGLYREDPSQVPYDYDEILEALAPRRVLLFAPEQDRDATFS